MYMKCKYKIGMFTDELFVDMDEYIGDDIRHYPFYGCFVNKDDIIKMGDLGQGLLKLRWYQIQGDKASVGINDLGAHKVSSFTVPKSAIAEKPEDLAGMVSSIHDEWVKELFKK